jgi:hypothetical protein
MQNFREWVKNNPVDDNMKYKQAYISMVDKFFMLADLAHSSYYLKYTKDEENFDNKNKAYEDWNNSCMEVVAIHCSKSITVPIVKINFADDLRLIILYNFYFWSISVISDIKIKHNFYDLISTEDKGYFHGWDYPEEYQFTSYKENKFKFSTAAMDFQRLWAFVYLVLEGRDT